MAKQAASSDVKAALRLCRAHFGYALVFNAIVNILLLAFPIFTIQLYERVIASRSMETLLALVLGLVIALVFKAIFQWVRGTLFVRASVRIDRLLSNRVLAALIERSGSGQSHETAQALRDLDSFRQFATGKGALALIDAPWAAVFSGVLLALDWQIGLVALACTFLMSAATIVNSIVTKRAVAESAQAAMKAYAFADSNLRSSEAIVAMGMVQAVVGRWRRLRDPALHGQSLASQRGVLFNAVLGSARILVQGVVMAAGVIEIMASDAPSGLLFAALIISQMAMRPIDQLVAAWEDYVPARQALQRVDALLSETARPTGGLTLPRPLGALTCDGVIYIPPGSDQPVLKGVTLSVKPGESLGLIGLNGSGKTTLARLIVGNLKPTRGQVRLDGISLWSSDREAISRHVGYLPQNIGLLSGTVADNIGRFGKLSDEDVVAAATMAGVHDVILRLPKGYDTEIGDGGHPISGGQRQLIALARAVAGNPSLVVLDEPNSNLDGPAEEALVACMAQLKERGVTVVLITHRPNLVRDLDHAVVLREGEVVSAGSTENVFKRLGRPIVVKSAASVERS
jgi:PrtD family type I secretion system ABC transporter